MANASKLVLMASVVLVFFGVLLLVFFLAARARGKAQTPLARLIFLGPAAVLLLIGLVIPAVQTTYQSFLGTDGKDWVGLANYQWIFGTEANWVWHCTPPKSRWKLAFQTRAAALPTKSKTVFLTPSLPPAPRAKAVAWGWQ